MNEKNTNTTGMSSFSDPDTTYGKINQGCEGCDCSGSIGYQLNETDDENWFENELEKLAREESCQDKNCDVDELTTQDMLRLLLDDHTEIMNRLENIESQLKKIKKKL